MTTASFRDEPCGTPPHLVKKFAYNCRWAIKAQFSATAKETAESTLLSIKTILTLTMTYSKPSFLSLTGKITLLFVSLAVFTVGCNTPKTEEAAVYKPVEELSWRTILQLGMQDVDGTRIEYHEDVPVINTGDSVVLTDSDAACKNGDGSCGKARYVVNNGDKKAKVIMKIAAVLNDRIIDPAWEFELAPSDSAYVACTVMCYAGKEYEMRQTIMVSDWAE